MARYGSGKTAGPAIPPAPALRTSFPEVEELRIELNFDHELQWKPSDQVHILHPPARMALLYACPYPGCSGKFDLERPVTNLLKDSSRSYSSHVRCTGIRPRKGVEDPTCPAHMNFKLSARYIPQQVAAKATKKRASRSQAAG